MNFELIKTSSTESNCEQFTKTAAALKKKQCSICFEENLSDILIYLCNKYINNNCEICLQKLFLNVMHEWVQNVIMLLCVIKCECCSCHSSLWRKWFSSRINMRNESLLIIFTVQFQLALSLFFISFSHQKCNSWFQKKQKESNHKSFK